MTQFIRCPITKNPCNTNCDFYIVLTDFEGCAFKIADMAIKNLMPEATTAARFLDKVLNIIRKIK